MTTWLLRDDDPNATTDPARLERTYAPLFDAGCAINFSVIPEVALDTRAPDGVRERFVDEGAPDTHQTVTLTHEHEMARWLRTHDGSVDVFQHGLTHERVRGDTEFGALTDDEAAARMDRGHAVLSSALGRPPSGFVAPWDALSRGSITAALQRFPVVSTGWVDRHKLPLRAWPAHVAERLRRSEKVVTGGRVILRHRGGPIGASLPPIAVSRTLDRLAHDAEITVVVLHHWMFWERTEPHPVVVELARCLRGQRTITAREIAA
jgi:Uncharacterized protein conserved in bacteria (DUF2334)